MSNDFQKALDFVLKHEVEFEKGHYGDMSFVRTERDPNDPGGTTRYGIDQRSHNVDIDKLTLEQATEIYRKDYWEKGKCTELPWPISLAHFDGCVNVGIGRATKILQTAVMVDADGIFGIQTKQATNDACNAIGAKAVAEKICDIRRAFYNNLCLNKPSMKQYQIGWFARCSDLKATLNQVS